MKFKEEEEEEEEEKEKEEEEEEEFNPVDVLASRVMEPYTVFR